MSEAGAPPAADGDGGPEPALAPRRLHPAGAVLSALDNVRQALVSIVVLVVVGSTSTALGPYAALLAVVGAIAATAIGYARWRAERYWIADGAIHHRHGVIAPDETVVPLARVHSIDTSQGPVQRLFGVHELHVQTAGGGERGEIVLRAVAPAETARLRAAAGLSEAAPAPGTADRPEWRLPARDLLLVGLTAPQIGVLAPLAGGTFALLENVLGDGARDALADRLPTEGGAIALLIALALAAAWLIAFLGSIVAFAGFSAVRDGDRLRIRRGLLERRATTVPLRRVHALSVAESPLRRPFGLASVRLETAGYGREPTAARTLFPLIRLAELDTALADLVPSLSPAPATTAQTAFERPPRRAARRYLLPPTATTLLAMAALAAIWSPALLLLPVVTAAVALRALARYRNAGWRLSPSILALRHGAFTRRTLIASPTRLQDHSLAQNPLQRRALLANLSVTVASGTTAAIAHLDAPTATTLFQRLRPQPG